MSLSRNQLQVFSPLNPLVVWLFELKKIDKTAVKSKQKISKND